MNIMTEHEATVTKNLASKGFPEFIYSGLIANQANNFLAMTMLGPSLDDLLSMCGGIFTLKTSCMIFMELIDRIEYMHKR